MDFKPDIMDALTELVGLGIGKAADVLNSMLDSHIGLSVPSVRLVHGAELVEVLSRDGGNALSAVQMRYAGSMKGSVDLIFSAGEAGRLVDCIIGEETVLAEEGLDALRSGTLCEVGNIIINAIMGTLSNVLKLNLSYTVPSYIEGNASLLVDEAGVMEGHIVLLAETEFTVEAKSIRGRVAIFFSPVSFELLHSAVREFADIPA
jgi:chemotaxis protein CheC